MRPFNKTTATLVRPRPFSTLCPTPLGKSPVCPRVSQLRDREAHAQTGGGRVGVRHVRLGDQAEDEAVGARGVSARRDLRIHV